MLGVLGARLLNLPLNKQKLLKNFKKKEYNDSYFKLPVSRISEIKDLEEAIADKIITLEQMCQELANSRNIIFSDVHFSKKQKSHIVKILEEMGDNYVAGMELFRRNHKRNLRKYSKGKISQEELYSRIGYTFLMESYGDFGYKDVVTYLGSKNIKIIGINHPMTKKLEKFLRKMEEEGKRPPFDYPEGTSEEDLNFADFYLRDKYVAEISDDFPKRPFVIIIGANHCVEDHLPRMIKQKSGIDPSVVEWNLEDFEEYGGDVFVNDESYNKLRERIG